MLRHVQPLLGIVLRDDEAHKIDGGKTSLSTGRDEDEHRLVRGVLPDGLEGGLVHGGHAGAVMFAGEAGDVNLERDGAD